MDQQKEPTIADLKAELAAIQQRLNAKIAAEKSGRIAQIKQLMDEGGITAEDLGFITPGAAVGRKPRAVKAGATEKAEKGAVYELNGVTWAGRGRQPAVIVEYLNNGGKLADIKKPEA